MKKRLLNNLPLLYFHILSLLVVVANFPVAKYLAGWDSLHPEFNFLLNLKRGLTPFWQENYGVGTITGHGFAATLPHTLITWILSLTLPMEAIRPTFMLLMLYVGGLGMYFLVNKLVSRTPYLGLMASLLYMTNLATIQIFYVPLEAFVVQFAALPWIFLSLIAALETPSKKNLCTFAFISLLASVQGFIPALFVAYFLSLLGFLFIFVIFSSYKRVALKKAIIVIFITLGINAYWLLPVAVFQKTNIDSFLSAYNNQLSTEEFIARHKKYGDIKNLSILASFYLDSTDGEQLAFEPFITHYSKPVSRIFGFGIFAIILLGFFHSIKAKKDYKIVGLAVVFAISFIALAADVPLLKYFHDFFQLIPLVRQAFRSSFTKFGILASFSYSLFFAYGVVQLSEFLAKKTKKPYSHYIVYLIVFALVFFLSLPVFEGNLFYKKLQVKIPSSYFSLMDKLNALPDGRIADFPQDCPEGWYGHSWGYFGSGFLWYGVKDPFMSRTFDVWNKSNEQYYWEITRALRSDNMESFDKVLQKYDVRYVMYDQNFLHCRSQKSFLKQETLLKHLFTSDKYKLIDIFSDETTNPIVLFEAINRTSESYVDFLNTSVNVGPSNVLNDQDIAYETNGAYITSPDNRFDSYYPLLDLFTKRDTDHRYDIENDGELVSFSTQIPTNLTGLSIRVPEAKVEEITPAKIQIIETQEKTAVVLSPRFMEISLDSQIIYHPSVYTLGQFANAQGKNLKIYVNEEEVTSRLVNNELYVMLYTGANNTIRITDDMDQVLFAWRSENDRGFNEELEASSTLPLFFIDRGRLTVKVPKIYDGAIFGKTFFDKDMLALFPQQCLNSYHKGDNKFEKNDKKDEAYIRLLARDERQCLAIEVGTIPTSLSYLLEIRTRNVVGEKPIVQIRDKKGSFVMRRKIESTSDYVTYYLIIPPANPHDVGYTVDFENYSLNSDISINDFAGMASWAIPLKTMQGLSIFDSVRRETLKNTPKIDISVKVNHINEAKYLIETTNLSPSTLVLYQGYHPGWKAYIGSKELKNHVLVNNWANGWEIDPADLASQSVTLVFWPQYLEFIGLGLLALSFLGILVFRFKN